MARKIDTTRVRLNGKETKISNVQLAEAITASNGILTVAVNYLKDKYKLDICRNTLENYIKDDVELQQVMANAKEKIKDKAESVMLKALASNDLNIALRASGFYLRTQAKDRANGN